MRDLAKTAATIAAMKTKKVAAGWYTVDTTKGQFEVRHVDTEPGTGYPPAWMVTWPHHRTPDAAVPTLRAAKLTIAADLQDDPHTPKEGDA